MCQPLSLKEQNINRHQMLGCEEEWCGNPRCPFKPVSSTPEPQDSVFLEKVDVTSLAPVGGKVEVYGEWLRRFEQALVYAERLQFGLTAAVFSVRRRHLEDILFEGTDASIDAYLALLGELLPFSQRWDAPDQLLAYYESYLGRDVARVALYRLMEVHRCIRDYKRNYFDVGCIKRKHSWIDTKLL